MKFKEMKKVNKLVIIVYLIAGVVNVIVGIKTINIFQILLGIEFLTNIPQVKMMEEQQKNYTELNMKYIKKNKELNYTLKKKERNREYYQKNKEKRKEYYQKNKDRYKEYYQKNKDKINKRRRERRREKRLQNK